MKSRIARALLGLCTAVLVLCHGAGSCLAERETKITAYASFVVEGDDMYVCAYDGLWRRNLLDRREECLISAETMEDRLRIGSDYSLLIWNHALALVDWENGGLWRWTGGTFERVAALQGAEAFNRRYTDAVAVQGDVLWMISNGALWACDIPTGDVRSMHLGGICEIAAHPEGGIVAIRDANMAYEVVRVASPSAEPQTLAQLANDSGGLACDGDTGAIYASVSGSLCRLDGDAWTPLRPLSRMLAWQCCTIYRDNFLYADNNVLYTVPFAVPSDSVCLNVCGVTQIVEGDLRFSTENPGILIRRQSLIHYCAEEIYQAIVSGNSDIDLFLVEMSSGVRNLMQKGYLQAVSSSEILRQDTARLYDFAREGCSCERELYAVPFALYLDAWGIRKEYAKVAPPATVSELVAFVRAWEKEDGGLPAIAGTFLTQPWARKEYAVYAVRQLIMRGDERTLRFHTPSFIACLEQCMAIGDNGPAPGWESLADTQYNAVINTHDSDVLSGDAAAARTIIRPPTLEQGDDVAVPATMYVYVVNPLSTHKAEAIAYLEYVTRNRGDVKSAMLCRDATATVASWSTKNEAWMATEIEAARNELDGCPPEERRAREETLAILLAQTEQREASDERWLVHPEALEQYRTLYVPYVNLQLTPLLEDRRRSHLDMWSLISDCLDSWLGGRLTAE